MMGKIVGNGMLLAALVAASMAMAGTAEARDGRNGAFAGGAAAGLLGGALLGGALANRNRDYDDGYDEPAPVYVRPRCFYQRQRVQNQYSAGWHVENVRVCR